MPSSFTKPLVVREEGGRFWTLMEPFEFLSERAERIIRVPVGFVTDFASIPRFLWAILPPTGRYGKAAVVHDFLYQTGEMSRLDADNTFLEGMEVLGVPYHRRYTMYWAVRAFGGRYYAG